MFDCEDEDSEEDAASENQGTEINNKSQETRIGAWNGSSPHSLSRKQTGQYLDLGLLVSRTGKPFLFFLFRAAPSAYVNSQARESIGATADSLCHSYSNVGSELSL